MRLPQLVRALPEPAVRSPTARLDLARGQGEGELTVAYSGTVR
ncbi:hypothetical protein [Polymorphospora lycopeni]|uniref:Uncharacterized protein n=1 Tax=Polymorphospora lycopeni TaxID=3140240 RepID=A0ABV5CJR5_9ACTN